MTIDYNIKAMPFRVSIVEEKLSDGSLVYNVRVPAMYLGAITEKDAQDLAHKVTEAVSLHTNDPIVTSFSYGHV